MIGRVKYRGVVFGVHAVASTHKGHTVVRPIVVPVELSDLVDERNLAKCVGRAFKTEQDTNSDDFGVRLATCRAYRMLIGKAKVHVQRATRILEGMQKDCRAEQDSLHAKRYPKQVAA
jgi:hypothetical protein